MKALEDRESQRLIARKHGFVEGADVAKLRAAFMDLNPNAEGNVARDDLKALLVDYSESASNSLANVQRELTTTHPSKVGFEVFAKFMKKKIDSAIRRRTQQCVAD